MRKLVSCECLQFYTGESPADFTFKGHSGPVKSISWLEDDTGFATLAWDSSIFLWKLFPDKAIDESGASNYENKAGLPVWEFKIKNNTFNCVSIFRPEPKEGEDCEPIVYCTVNSDKSIREIKTL
jgi:WD40 repeat protein